MAKTGRNTPEKRDKKELESAVSAFDAAQHNPIEWTPIIKFVAPIVARVAARYVLKTVARKLNKRITPRVREETVVQAADYLADIALKRTRK